MPANPNATYGNGNNVVLTHPKLNGYNIHFVGTSPQSQPIISVEDGTNNAWNSIVVDGTSTQQGQVAYGEVRLWPPAPGNVTLANGIQESYGHLTLDSANGGTYTVNGNSLISNSVLTVDGGRYQADPFILKGNLTVSNGIAQFYQAPLEGPGTVHIEAGGTVEMKTVLAGLHVNVDKGGDLFLFQGAQTPLISAGTINEAAGASVIIVGAASPTLNPRFSTAALEVFHQASGTLDLLNKSGAEVASVKFAPGSHEYSSITASGNLEITTNPMMPGTLPTIFTH